MRQFVPASRSSTAAAAGSDTSAAVPLSSSAFLARNHPSCTVKYTFCSYGQKEKAKRPMSGVPPMLASVREEQLAKA